MVQLHVKRGDESQFLFDTTTDAPVEAVTQQITAIYNGRLKVARICSGENLPVLTVYTHTTFYIVEIYVETELI